MVSNKVGNRQLRSFGLVVGSGFAIIALWPLLRGHNLRVWSLALSIFLLAMALLLPRALRPFHRLWMILGEALGWLNSRILLSILYYLVIVPIAVIRRTSGNDPMRRKFEPSVTTYKIPRTRRPASHMQRQY
jgi:hypothetical protein